MDYTIYFPANYVKPSLPGGKEWIEALRSGKYLQGREWLRYDEKYCCLGVLCDLQGRLIEDNEFHLRSGYGEVGGNQIALSFDNPLFEKLSFIGFFPCGVKVYDRNTLEMNDCLMTLNDSGFSFNQIADIIEQIWDCQENPIEKDEEKPYN